MVAVYNHNGVYNTNNFMYQLAQTRLTQNVPRVIENNLAAFSDYLSGRCLEI